MFLEQHSPDQIQANVSDTHILTITPYDTFLEQPSPGQIQDNVSDTHTNHYTHTTRFWNNLQQVRFRIMCQTHTLTITPYDTFLKQLSLDQIQDNVSDTHTNNYTIENTFLEQDTPGQIQDNVPDRHNNHYTTYDTFLEQNSPGQIHLNVLVTHTNHYTIRYVSGTTVTRLYSG